MVFVSGPVPWASGTATTAVIEHVAFAEIVPAVIVSVPVPTPPKTGAPQFALPTADTSVKLAGKLSVIAAFVSGTDVKKSRMAIVSVTFCPGCTKPVLKPFDTNGRPISYVAVVLAENEFVIA